MTTAQQHNDVNAPADLIVGSPGRDSAGNAGEEI
jgi:hypothetical protein